MDPANAAIARVNRALVAQLLEQDRLAQARAERDAALDELARLKREEVLGQVQRRDDTLRALCEEEEAVQEEIAALKLSMHSDRALKSGLLEKRSAVLKQFAVRHIVLTTAGLFSFRWPHRSGSTGSAMGAGATFTSEDESGISTNLADATVQLIFDATQGTAVRVLGERMFEVSSGAASMVLQAASAAEAAEWMDAISNAIGGVVVGTGVAAVADLGLAAGATTASSFPIPPNSSKHSDGLASRMWVESGGVIPSDGALPPTTVVTCEFEVSSGCPNGSATLRKTLLPALHALESQGVGVRAVVQSSPATTVAASAVHT